MKSSPRVSIIIPTYNRPDSLKRALNSISEQVYDDIEVVVVDDGSTDNVSDIVNRDYSFILRYVSQDHRGGTQAKNQGASVARGDLLIFLDDDIKVAPNFILSLVAVHQCYQKVLVTGQLIEVPLHQVTIFSRIYTHNGVKVYQHLATSKIPFTECFGGFFSIKRMHFFELGMLEGVGSGWPNWEDVYFGYKAHKAGFICLKSWAALGWHFDKSLSNLYLARNRWFRASNIAPLLFKSCPGVESFLPMFCDKTPIEWHRDSPSLIFRKIARQMVSLDATLWGIDQIIKVLERFLPSPSLLRLLYRWSIGGYIFRGFRQGLREFGPLELSSDPSP